MEVETLRHAGITRLNKHVSEQSVGDPLGKEGQGSLEYCFPWYCKELDMAEQLKKYQLCITYVNQEAIFQLEIQNYLYLRNKNKRKNHHHQQQQQNQMLFEIWVSLYFIYEHLDDFTS